jgi:hypothetical protein
MHRQEIWQPDTVELLIHLLRRSSTPEQFIYREAELDEYWRFLDDEIRTAPRGERAAVLEQLKASVMRAHDLAAEGHVAEAADGLHQSWQACRHRLS